MITLYTPKIPEFLIFTFFFIVISIAVQFVLNYFIDRYKGYVNQKFIIKSIDEKCELLLKKKYRSLSYFNMSYLHSRLLEDLSKVWNFYFEIIVSYLSSFINLIFIMLILLRTDYKLFFIALIFVPVYFVIYLAFYNKLSDVNLKLAESSNDLYAYRNAFLERTLDLKLRGNFSDEMRRINQKSESLLKNILRSFKLNYSIFGLKLSANSIFKVLLFIYLGKFVMHDALTVGVFIYLIQYMDSLINSLSSIMQTSLEIPAYNVAKQRLNEINELPSDKCSKRQLADVEKIEIKNFNFNYDEDSLYTKSVNFRFYKGKSYIVTGKNGVGKSTLIHAIAGIYDEDNYQGEILINDINIKELDREKLRKMMFSIMPQNKYPVLRTVEEYLKDNNALVSSKCDDREFLNLFYSDDFNLNSCLDKNFDELSMGEKQMINMYICLNKETEVYILDEATANLHPKLKSAADELLETIAKKDKIVIHITHLDSKVKNNLILE